mmetsp:Transcript_40643/g.88655  ORF Transcript_40643/g.88655 Transcript_40643/m.88655 type:complete len:90 (-) Transcript_40643:2105-2374(-)
MLLVNLDELSLSFNHISQVENMNPKLSLLDLSFNQIQSIDNFPKLRMLKELRLNNNLICKTEELEILGTNCPLIDSIRIRNNPLTEQKN